MAAWCAPVRLLLLGTPESLENAVAGEPVVDLIARLGGIAREQLEVRRIREPEELHIYREVSLFATYHGLGPRELAIDPTGGKKSMSASAALSGYLTGAWLVYVDYAAYRQEQRIPVPGTEYPRLLHNPLEVFGEHEFGKVRAALNRGGFEEAAHLARQLADRLYESRQAEVWELLAQALGDWERFNFPAAAAGMQRAVERLRQFGILAPWPWAEELLPVLEGRHEKVPFWAS
jgi:CRISPR/Cas system-associated protein Csm6